MKKKFTYFVAAVCAALTFSACSSDKLEAYSGQTLENPESPSNAISFGTYMGRTTTTRATVGKIGDITQTNEALKAADAGFGVFAYYTKSTNYAAGQTSTTPNFMYNEGVTWNSTKWEYAPIKYWPNGLNDQNDGVGGDDGTLTAGGKVSFFAYAPFVATPGTVGTDDGIIDFSANSAASDPTVTYKMPSTNMVDLLWGTSGTTASGKDLAGNDQAGTTLSNQTILKDATNHYYVNADLTKQQIDGAVRFNFIHALSKVGGSANDGVAGGLQIMLDIDQLSGGTEDNNTKVTVKSIKINTDYNHNGDLADDDVTMYNKGTLNLATGVWTLSNASADKYVINQTIDVTGTAPNSQLNTEIAEPTSVTDWVSIPEGVKVAKKNVYYTGQENSPLLFIPGTTPKLQITINYIVRTQDANIDGGWSFVEQTVTKTVTFSEAVKLNKKYNLIIHLGLTSVKFEATVENWSADINNDSSVNESDQTTVYLPLNVQ